MGAGLANLIYEEDIKLTIVDYNKSSKSKDRQTETFFT